MNRVLNVYIITQQEPFFVPKMLSVLASRANASHYRINGVTVMKPYRKNKSFWHWFGQRSRIYTAGELLIVGFAFAWTKLVNRLKGSGSPFSVSSLCRKHSINLFSAADVNDETFVQRIRELKTDIIISISCPQLFRGNLLKAPTLACVNAHGTLLPRHRGVFGSWWMLYNEDPVGGSTIHTMVEEVDKGDILWQKEFRITPSHTQFSIAWQTKKDMADGLIEVITRYGEGKAAPVPATYESSYHYAPTKALGREFHAKGKRVITLSNLKLMLAANFDKA